MARSGLHPVATADPAPVSASGPPPWWPRWGWALPVLLALGGLATWCGVSPPYPTRAELQTATASIAAARADCATQIQAAVGAQTAQIQGLVVGAALIEERVRALGADQERTYRLVERMALRQGVQPEVERRPAAPVEGPMPAPAPAPPSGP